jgi:FAD/FMN-containing dehydrogenase
VAIGALFLKAYIWDDPSKQWLMTDLFPYDEGSHKLTLAPPEGTLLADASGLNSSLVSEIRSPTTVDDILQAISDAKSSNRKISLSGIRHSMGGQALGQKTLHLDMTHMDFVRYNDSDQTITVGPGATWRQAQTALSPRGRAVRVMQDSNIFTVGGALSVNVHGKDPRYGSLIDTVNYLKVVTVDGNEVRCDRTQNSDLFSSVIGGYGVLGVITEVNLLTTPNSVYAFSLIPTQTHSLLNMLESLSKDPAIQLLEAHLSVDAEHLLTNSLIYRYAEVESAVRPKDDLSGENSIWLRKIIFQASRASNFGKVLRWELEKVLTPLVEAKTVSRNTAMAVPVRFLQNPDPQTTDVLQEYFVPTARVNDFLGRYGDLIKTYGINLLNVTVRKVKQDTNALVSYAQRDMYGFVVYYKVTKNSVGVQALDTFTRALIDYLIAIEATYYLCYGSYYSPSQLTTMYPEIPNSFALKAHHDPDGLLTNLWYEKYRL